MPSLQLVSDIEGHSEPAWCVSWNPKRSLLASCSTDKTIRLYNYSSPPPSSLPSSSLQSSSPSPSKAIKETFPSPDSRKPIFHLSSVIPTEHKRTIRSIAWSPSGKSFATGSFDSSVGVWEEVDAEGSDDDEDIEEEGEGVFRPKGGHVHGAGCGHSHSHEDGHGNGENQDEDEDGDGDIDLEISGDRKEPKEWECVTTLEGHDSECKSVGWSSNGVLLASCSRDKSVWVWEVQPDSDFECIAVMMDHNQDVKNLSWHPHEEILASASYDSHIHLMWDDPSGDWCIFQKLHPKLPASPLTIPSSSSSVITALRPSEEEAKALEELKIPALVEDETVWSLAWSPDGKFLASGGDLGGVRIWERMGQNPDSPLKEILHTAAHSRSVFSLSWGSGGISSEQGGKGLLASTGGDGKIIIWQISVLQSPDTSTEKSAGKLHIQPIAATRDAHGVNDVNSIAWCERSDGKSSSNNGLLASCGDDGSVRVWRVVSD